MTTEQAINRARGVMRRQHKTISTENTYLHWLKHYISAIRQMLTGPAACIEIIVRKAARESGVEMDWGYIGGRAAIHANGERAKARSALYHAMPKSDLTQADF